MIELTDISSHSAGPRDFHFDPNSKSYLLISEMAANCHRNTVYSIIRYLDGANLAGAARSVERQSGLFFNLNYFEDRFISGNLDDAENYLSGFTTVDDNSFSSLVFFEIRWHKFILALDQNERQRARKILREELRTFQRFHYFLTANGTELLGMDNFRDGLDEEYKDLAKARVTTMEVVRNNLEANPLLKGKIVYNSPRVNFGFSDLVHPPTPFPTVVIIPAPTAASPGEADQIPAPAPALPHVSLHGPMKLDFCSCFLGTNVKLIHKRDN